MCDQQLLKLFVSLKKPQEVTLGDGHSLEVVGQGIVTLEMRLPSGKIKRRNLMFYMCVPKFTYNLLSVTKVSKAGKKVCLTRMLAQKGKGFGYS